jgi:hypothetical protein
MSTAIGVHLLQRLIVVVSAAKGKWNFATIAGSLREQWPDR